MGERDTKWRNKLFRFQRQGVRFLERRNGRGIIGDDMGLGKTLQAVFWLKRDLAQRTPAIIVCPSSVKLHWKRELAKEGIDSEALKGFSPYESDEDVWILNYCILQHWQEQLLTWNPKSLIIDELHLVKNRRAKRTKACKRISRQCEHVIGLSGTPIKNRPEEYFPILNMLEPDKFKSFLKYALRYCDAKMADFGADMDTSGATHLDELHERTEGYMIRRMKEEVMEDLPDKMYSAMPIEIDNMAEYVEARDDFRTWMAEQGKDVMKDESGRMEVFAKIRELKKLAAMGKLDTEVEWIDNWLDRNEKKLVVFAAHHDVVDRLHEEFSEESVCIDGRVKAGEERQAVVDKFVEDDGCRLLIATIKTAGTGLDSLQKVSDTVAFVELEWSPKDHEQAEDRIRRIGQKANKCSYYYFIGENTIEENIIRMLGNKNEVIEKVVDGQARSNVMADIVSTFK